MCSQAFYSLKYGFCSLRSAVCLPPQFYNYFLHYPNDKLALKLAVSGLALLTVLKSIQAL